MWERLWRRTVTLAREYPALWLPVICADVVAFSLRSSRKVAALSVARFLLLLFHEHSVLMGSTALGDSSAANTFAFAAVALVGFVLEASSVVVYAIAFVVTDRMVRERVGVRTPGEKRRTVAVVVALSVRGLLVAWLLGIANALILWAVMHTRWHALTTWWIFTQTVSAVTMCAFAYVMSPPAMRLLAAQQPTEQSFRLGRKCAVAAVLASAGLMTLEHIIFAAAYGSHTEIFVIRAIASLIAALPYAPLYIALTLLAREPQTEVVQQPGALLPNEA